MADQFINVRLKHATKTSEEWQAADKPLLKDELGYDSTNRKFKVGDGTSLWPNLSYINAENATSATYSSTANYAKAAGSASSADKATSASSAVYSSRATSASSAVYASKATSASSAVYATSAGSAGSATNATNASTAEYAKQAASATNATNATNASSATNADLANKATSATSATYATTATNAGLASKATSATSATYASTANYSKTVLQNAVADSSTVTYHVPLSTNASTAAATGALNKSTKLTFKPSTGELKATKFIGNGSGLTNLNASALTSGTIDVERLPKTAVERLIIVETDTERFALTSDNVQEGDTVKVVATGMMYFVVDATKLSTEAGYVQYVASTNWSAITGKPDTYAKATSASSAVYATRAGSAGSASNATNAGTADYATNAGSAAKATSATSARYATTATSADSASKATSATSATYASTATNAGTATYASSAGSANKATSASSAVFASKATSATSASYAVNAGTAKFATDSSTALYAINAGSAANATNASTAAYARNAGTAAYSTNGAKASSATSATYASTANYGKAVLQNKNTTADASTITYPVMLATNASTGDVQGALNKSSKLLFTPSSGNLTANTFTGSLSGNAASATYSSKSASATSSRYATTATSAGTASKATSATSARYATTATNAGTATYAKSASTATYSPNYLPLTGGTLNGNLAVNGGVVVTGHLNPASMEIFPGTSAGHGGYIDFHFNNSTADYTSRIIEATSGILSLNKVTINGSTVAGYLNGQAAKSTSATSATYSSTANYAKAVASSALISTSSVTISNTNIYIWSHGGGQRYTGSWVPLAGNYTLYLTKVGKIVTIQGLISARTAPKDCLFTTIFANAIPSGFRPPVNTYISFDYGAQTINGKTAMGSMYGKAGFSLMIATDGTLSSIMGATNSIGANATMSNLTCNTSYVCS